MVNADSLSSLSQLLHTQVLFEKKDEKQAELKSGN